LKSPLIDVDNKHNKFFPSFSFFNKEFKPENCFIDLFSDHFSFHSCSSNAKKHIKKLDDIALRALSNPSSTIVVSDASIKNHVITLISHIHSFKNHVATSISHIYFFDKPIVKTIHRAINITMTEAKLSAI